MPTNPYQKTKQHYHPLFIKLLYILGVSLIGIYWEKFISIPTNYLAGAAVLWILNLYRTLNVDKTTIQNQFFIAFWVRMGWASSYSLYSTGKLYGDRQTFTYNLIQCLIVTSIYTAIPLSWVQYIWKNRIYRFCVFFIDQIFANGHSFHSLMNKQIFGKTLNKSIAILASKATARPIFQIITGFYNDNLFWNNLRKWSTICYLNTCRILLLGAINYLVVFKENNTVQQLELLRYFNVCYYGFVGYLMYLESYTL